MLSLASQLVGVLVSNPDLETCVRRRFDQAHNKNSESWGGCHVRADVGTRKKEERQKPFLMFYAWDSHFSSHCSSTL